MGETILVNQSPFVVVGVMQTKKQMGMYGGPDADHAVIPLTTFQAMFGRRYLSNLVFKAAAPELMEVAKKRFNEVLGREVPLRPGRRARRCTLGHREDPGDRPQHHDRHRAVPRRSSAA